MKQQCLPHYRAGPSPAPRPPKRRRAAGPLRIRLLGRNDHSPRRIRKGSVTPAAERITAARELRDEPFDPGMTLQALQNAVNSWDCHPRRRNEAMAAAAELIREHAAGEDLTLRQWWDAAEASCRGGAIGRARAQRRADSSSRLGRWPPRHGSRDGSEVWLTMILSESPGTASKRPAGRSRGPPTKAADEQ